MPLKEKLLYSRINFISLAKSSVGGFLFCLQSNASMQASTPSFCGILVYNDVTSIVARRTPSGRSLIDMSFFRKSVVSWI